MKKKLLALVTAAALAVTSFSIVPVMAAGDNTGEVDDDYPAITQNWGYGDTFDLKLGEPVTGLTIKYIPSGYKDKYVKRDMRFDGPAPVDFKVMNSFLDDTMVDGYEKYNKEGILPSDRFALDMELTFTEPGLYTWTGRVWDEEGNLISHYNRFITVTETSMSVDVYAPAPTNFQYAGVEDGKYKFTWDAVPGPDTSISYETRIFGEGDKAVRRIPDTSTYVPVLDENGNEFNEKVVATDIRENKVLLDPDLFTEGKEYRMLLATASSNGFYGYRVDDPDTPVGKRIASTTFVAEDTTPAPQPTTYAVKIDGTDYQTVEEGTEITLPTRNVIGYYADGKLYKNGAKYTVDKAVDFSTVKLGISTGSSLKFADPTSMRFAAKLSSKDGAAIDNAVQSEGILVTTSAIYNDDVAGFVRGKDKVIDIANSGWYNNTKGSFCGSISGINSKYYAREYAVRAYATVKYSDNSVATVYSSVVDGKSVQGVAAVIKADSYNTLTDAQKAFIDKFLASK